MLTMDAVHVFENKLVIGDLDWNPDVVFTDMHWVGGLEDAKFFVNELEYVVMKFSHTAKPNFSAPFGADEMRALANFYNHVATCFEKVDEVAAWAYRNCQ